MTATAATGAQWAVSRRWLPWRPPLRRIRLARDLERLGRGELGWFIIVDLIEFVVWLLTYAVTVMLLVVALAVLALEWVVVLVLMLFVAPLRVFGQLPFAVVARGGDGRVYTGEVTGWAASRELIETVRAEIAEEGYPRSLRVCR